MVTIVNTVQSLRAEVAKRKADGQKLALVPTMGALHAGHLSLVKLARQYADAVVVTIFVNPTQFGPNEDFDKYPRQTQQDIALLEKEKAEVAFLPTVEEMYPQGFATTVSVSPQLTSRLCGAHRPGHFDGVTTVVSKLLLQAQADVAIFGEKDYQQLQVIRRMVIDLDIPTQIIGAPIAREVDGLAMSSRNAYLTANERVVAPRLQEILQETAEFIFRHSRESGNLVPKTPASAGVTALLKEAEMKLQSAGFAKVDYVELVDANSLQPLEQLDRPARLLAAATLGKTRLIDNLIISPPLRGGD